MARLRLSFIAVVMACTTQRDSSTVVTSEIEPYVGRIDSLFGRITSTSPGCAVGVYRDGEVLFAKNYGVASVETGGPITSRTTFNLGSASKPWTAIAVLRLARAGRLSLEDDVRKHVPELSGLPDGIRIRDLLQHTSGLRDFGALDLLRGKETRTMSEFLSHISTQQLNFAPQSQHEYSHSDFLVLGMIVERVVGEPFGAWLEREVLKPMGMTALVQDARRIPMPERAHGHEQTTDGWRMIFPEGQLVGGDNVYASIEDLRHWDAALAAASDSAIATVMTRPLLANGDTIPYAYGLRIRNQRGVKTFVRGGHSAGLSTEFIRYPEHRTAVATLCNGDSLYAGLRAHDVGAILLGEHMKPLKQVAPPAAAVPASDEELRRYTGIYRNAEGDDISRIVVHNGKLAELLSDTSQGMTYRGNGEFTGDGSPGDFRLRFSQKDTEAMKLEFVAEGEVVGTRQRVPDGEVWRPDGATLASYAGTYYSPELRASWSLVPGDGTLILRRPGAQDLAMVAVRPLLFTRAFGAWNAPLAAKFAFVRDAGGAITSFTITTPPGEDVVRGLRFTRLH